MIESRTVPVLYEAPFMPQKQHLFDKVYELLHLDCPDYDLREWNQMLDRIRQSHDQVTIGLVGNYVKLRDAYLPVAKALRHGGYANGARVEIRWIEAETVTEESAEAILGDCDGILVPGGFGDRGVEGMIMAAHYARKHQIPYLGICLGMQTAAIEFARYALGYAGAHSQEFDPASSYKIIAFMADQSGELEKGSTMRLGTYPCLIQLHSRLASLYMAVPRSRNVTATVMSSTTRTARNLKHTVCGSAETCRTAISLKRLNWQLIRISLRCSIIRNSRAVPIRHIRYSPV